MSSGERRFVAIFGSIWISLFATCMVLFFISRNVDLSVDTSRIPELFAVPVANFKPEPLENTLFFSGAILLPVFLLFFYYLLGRLLQKMGERLVERIYLILYPVTMASLCILAFIGLNEDNFFYLQKSPILSATGILICATLTAACYFILLYPRRTGVALSAKLLQSFLYLLSFFSILTVAVYCVFGINSVTDSGIYRNHFNAVFHSVVQVYLGKELLVDLVHQYGLYPHFIEPVFRMLGLTVMKFTVFMGMLVAASFFFVLTFLRKITSSKIIAFLGFMVLMHFCYFHGAVLEGRFDPYFQYHPLRGLFPCLSVYLTHEFVRTNDKRLYYVSFVLYSIAVLWNFDSGFIVFASWMLVLMFQGLFKRDAKQMLMHAVRGIGIFALIFMVFNIYLYLRYGHVPDYRFFFLYQKIFYIYGFNMLPMPLVHTWNLVIIIYVSGLAYAIDALFQKEESRKALMIFFLSILGTGLFVYYQGRSHDLVLMAVSFPAVIIMTIFTDTLLSRTGQRNSEIDKIVVTGLLFLMFFATLSLLRDYPSVGDAVIKRLRPTLSAEASLVAQRAEFLKQNTHKGEAVLILSQHSGLYHLASETRCPLKIPGFSELFRQEDWRKIADYINSDAEKKFVIEDNPEMHFTLNFLYFVLMKNRILDVSQDGKLTVFVTR